MFDSTGLLTDDLEQLITTAEHAISQLRGFQVSVVGELDKRQVAAADGCRTMTDWISSRLDMRHDVASELLTASRTMPEPLRSEVVRGH